MTLKNIALIIIIFLLILMLIVSIWWAIFLKKIRKIENTLSERLQVIDIILAVKKEFLNKIVELGNIKTLKQIPKTIENNPQFLWTSLEREVYIKGLNNYEKEITGEVNKSNKKNSKAIKDGLKRVFDTEERIQTNIFIYNNQVLKYNYLLASKQGRFFLKTNKYNKKEVINVYLDKDKLKDLL